MAKRRKSATVQLKVRMKEAVRASLAAAAEEHEVTLNAEVVDRLEKSIGREKARHEEFGGRELYGLLKMMAGAAAMIEERRGGKRWSEDYETGMAARAAWQTLIRHAIPQMPKELQQELRVDEAMDAAPPDPGLPPVLPPSGPGLLGGHPLWQAKDDSVEASVFTRLVHGGFALLANGQRLLAPVLLKKNARGLVHVERFRHQFASSPGRRLSRPISSTAARTCLKARAPSTLPDAISSSAR